MLHFVHPIVWKHTWRFMRHPNHTFAPGKAAPSLLQSIINWNDTCVLTRARNPTHVLTKDVQHLIHTHLNSKNTSQPFTKVRAPKNFPRNFPPIPSCCTSRTYFKLFFILLERAVNVCGHPGCSLSFATFKQLQVHMKEDHFTGECTICHATFTNKRNLKDHYQTHDETRVMYPCSQCEKEFTKVRLHGILAQIFIARSRYECVSACNVARCDAFDLPDHNLSLLEIKFASAC